MSLVEKPKELIDLNVDDKEEEEELSKTPRGKCVKEEIERARNKWYELYKKNAVKEDQVIPVCEMSMKEFGEFADFFPKNCNFDGGIVFIKEIPNRRRQKCCSFLFTYMTNLFQETLDVEMWSNCRLGEERVKIPDVVAIPYNRKVDKVNIINKEDDYPAIAIEVAVSNESIPALRKELKDLVSPFTAIMIAIGIKMRKQREVYSIKFFMAAKASSKVLEYNIGEVFAPGKKVNRPHLPVVKLPIQMIFDGIEISELFHNMESLDLKLSELSSELLKRLERADYRNRCHFHPKK